MNRSLLPEAVVKHAGFVMAHAAVIVSVLEPHELICPFAVVTKGDNRESIEFEAENQDEAVSEAWSSLDKYRDHIDLWGMAREGLVTASGVKEDVLVVAVWTHGMPEAAIFTQQFRDRGNAFALVGPVALQSRSSSEELELMREWFHQGIGLHPKSSQWWIWANAAQQSAQAASPASGGPSA